MSIFIVSVSHCIHLDDGRKAKRDAFVLSNCFCALYSTYTWKYFESETVGNHLGFYRESLFQNQSGLFFGLFSLCELVASQQMVWKRSKPSRDTILGKTFSCQGEHLTNFFYSTNPLALFYLTWHNEDMMLAECTMFTLVSLPRTQSILQPHRLLL